MIVNLYDTTAPAGIVCIFFNLLNGADRVDADQCQAQVSDALEDAV